MAIITSRSYPGPRSLIVYNDDCIELELGVDCKEYHGVRTSVVLSHHQAYKIINCLYNFLTRKSLKSLTVGKRQQGVWSEKLALRKPSQNYDPRVVIELIIENYNIGLEIGLTTNKAEKLLAALWGWRGRAYWLKLPSAQRTL